MRVLNRLDISGSFGVGSTDEDGFVIGSPNTQNDILTVWAKSNFKNDVVLGSESSDLITVSGTLKNEGGASLTGSFSGSGKFLNELTASNIENFNNDVGDIFVAGDNVTINKVGIKYAISSSGGSGTGGTGGSVYTGGNITGSGTSTNPIGIKPDPIFNQVTASYYTGSGAKFNYIDFNVQDEDASQTVGRTFFDSGTVNLSYWTDINDIKVDVGEQLVLRVKNYYNSQAIPKGKVVHIISGSGVNPLIATSSYSSEELSAKTLGVTMGDIPGNNFGYVLLRGILHGVDTNGMTVGNGIYLNSDGNFSQVKPEAPFHDVRIGQVIREGNINTGVIYVAIQNGYELNELHDVKTNSPTNGDLLMQDFDGIWKNTKKLSGSYEIVNDITASNIRSNGKIYGDGSEITNLPNGSRTVSYSSKNLNYILTTNDYVVTFNNSNLTATLPSAQNLQGMIFVVKNLHTSSLFITSSNSSIDGSTTGLLIYNQYTSYTFVSDNNNWLII